MRTKIIAGNWKMNNDKKATAILIEQLEENLQNTNGRLIIAPPFTHLEQSVALTKDSRLEVAAQNMHQAISGAFTGEIAAPMLQSINVRTVILGHSERRTYFNETNHALAEKVQTALDYDMDVIFCFGEVLSERKEGKHFETVKQQLEEALFGLEAAAWKKIILAYEPVWAIGTGETASPEQAQEMHAYIRQVIASKYGAQVADTVSILYGGSVKPSNAADIFQQKDVDGGLIGGAALKAEDFLAIAKAI
ncbi:MAG: triose-phosphate isomerase [Flavobacteriaceae bacterium]